MTKVLHIYKSYFPETRGGIEQFIKALSAGTHLLGIENTLLTTGHKSAAAQLTDDLTVIRAAANMTIASCPFSLDFYRQFKHLCQQHDIIHLHFPWPFGELITYLLSQQHHKLVITYHADITKQKWLKQLYNPMMQQVLRRANHIIATSANAAQSSPILQRYAPKTSVIPLAINLEDYPTPTQALCQKWQQQVGKDFLLFIGQFRYYKGIEVLLKALTHATVPCVLIGDGPLSHQLQTQANTLALEQVHFVGNVSDRDKTSLIQLAHAIVLPSIARSEAFGLALLEGLAFNKPLISTELGTGTSFVNQHGKTGLVVPPNDPQALANAINTLFSPTPTTPDYAQTTSAHFKQYFQLSAVASKYVDIYRA